MCKETPAQAFLAKFNGLRLNKQFDIIEFNYINKYSEIKIKCKTHDCVLNVTGQYILRAIRSKITICPECRKNEYFKQWLINANIVHNYKYDYSKVNYINSKTKVTVVCPTHGPFNVKPSAHLNAECYKCAKEKEKNTLEYFLSVSNKVHNWKYDYSLVDPKSLKASDYAFIICPLHGKWRQRIGSHMQGMGCRQCSIDKSKIGKEGFIAKAKNIHGDTYDYSNVVYNDNKTKVEILCPSHGSFFVTPNSHLSQKTGCPKCRESFGEKTIRLLLTDLNIPFLQEYRLPYTLMRVDFYIPSHKLIIEFHGKQHFIPVDRFGGEKGLAETRRRDALKLRYAKENNLNIVVLTYRDLIKDRLLKKLTKILKIYNVT